MARSIPKARVSNGPGKGELELILKDMNTQLQALTADLTSLRTKFNAHLADGSHTAAANQTAGNVTTNTMGTLTASNLLSNT